MKNKKGFTLIELLAVVIILGILTTIAVVGVTRYINESRRNMYITSATKYIDAVKIKLTKEELSLKRKDTTYYVHIGNVELEEENKSPFGKWVDAYVAFTNSDAGYSYYWTSIDESGHKINVTPEMSLRPASIFVDPQKRINNSYPLDGKMNIIIIDKDGNERIGFPSLEMTPEEAEKCYSYRENFDDTITITLYKLGCDTSVVLPAYIDGKKVVEVFDYAFRGVGLTKVTFSNTIEKIGTRSFSYNNLTSVEIPPNLKTIGTEAFMGNKISNLSMHEGLQTLGLKAFFSNRITSFVLPESVTSLGSCAFCENPIPNAEFLYAKTNGVPDYSVIRGYIGDLKEFPDKKFIIPSEKNGIKLKVIQSGFIQNLPISDWEVVIPDTVVHIGSQAFWGCGIGKVILPSSLQRIDSAAFYVNRIRELVIPPSVTNIGAYAFNNNLVQDPEQAIIYKRTSTGIDYSSIVSYAGANRANVAIPAIKNGVELKRIESNAFAYVSLSGTIKLPNSVNYLGSNAFAIGSLTHFDNGDGVLAGPFIYKRLPNGGFDNTTLVGYAASGGAVTVPPQVKHIADYGFYYSRIIDVNLPEGLETIGAHAFNKCHLRSLIIPSTVTYIGPAAFTKVKVYTDYNMNLNKIVNKTGRSFNWQSITGSHYPAVFETGTVRNWYGNIEVVK